MVNCELCNQELKSKDLEQLRCNDILTVCRFCRVDPLYLKAVNQYDQANEIKADIIKNLKKAF